MATVSYHIANLLEKMTSSDKDFRFMATNDLMSELHKDSIKLDDDSEKKVVRMLLKLLEDRNGEVQNLAVKCLGPLVSKVKEYQVETIVDTLCSNMLSDKQQLRDISSIGLKTVISELPPASRSLAASVCKKITGRLTSAIAKQDDVSVQLEALDILGDLLSRFGGLLVTFHPSIVQALLPQLSSPRLAVRKRSIMAIGHLVMSCNQATFLELTDFLLSELAKNSSTSTTRTYIQCIGAITRQAGHQIGEHLERLVPLIVQFCQLEDDEVREYCIQAFDSFVRKCAKQMTPHIAMVTRICLQYLSYDPNYNYDDDDDENDMDMDDEDEDGESDDEYSDDDDMSWKVRRASSKCLQSVISARHDMLQDFYVQISPVLINRFKEREENVKADIFQTYITLLKQTKPSVTADPDAMEQDQGPVSLLQQQTPALVKAIHRQLKEKSIKTRQGCFSVLVELVHVLPGALNDHIPSLIPGIQFSLGDKNCSSNMKIDTLIFMNVLLQNHSPQVFHPHIPVLVPPVVSAVNDQFYKITSEALLVTQQLVKVIRPLDEVSNFDFRPYVQQLYVCTLHRLKATDIDQEVKERAISCMGQIISNLGDGLGQELSICLPIFLERLRNEITRLTTVKAVAMIAGSSLKINLIPILGEAIPILSTFLRKNHRALRLSTLLCLDVLVRHFGGHMSAEMFAEIMKELPALITENDLHISQLTMTLLTSVCNVFPASMAQEQVAKKIIPQLLLITKSALLQGSALTALLGLFQAIVSTNTRGLRFHDLLDKLHKPILSAPKDKHNSLAVHKQAFQSIAKCIAALILQCEAEGGKVIMEYIKNANDPKTTESMKLLALLTIGEVGQHKDLSKVGDVQTVITNCFTSSTEEVKSAASYALGNLSVGNMPHFLPFVLHEIEKQSKRQYLLLHSLKEIINCQSVNSSAVECLQPYVNSIWDLLMKHCECPEEGTRNVVAECLGRLALINPTTLLPKLREFVKSPSAIVRSTVITAVKFTISDQPQAVDSLLRVMMSDFLEALHDSDLNVRRVALVAFNSAAHNKPSLVRDLLSDVLPHLYCETNIRSELIREVEMGPFKHTVDDGLDLRKAAFECMYTLLDSCLDRIDIYEYLKHVEDGLSDHYDIKMLTYLMLVRLSNLCPDAILQHLERIVEPLRTTCTAKVKANSVKQEFEKQDELKRSALRALLAILHIPDAAKNPLMNEFHSQIQNNYDLRQMFEVIQKDASSNNQSQPDIHLMDVS